MYTAGSCASQAVSPDVSGARGFAVASCRRAGLGAVLVISGDRLRAIFLRLTASVTGVRDAGCPVGDDTRDQVAHIGTLAGLHTGAATCRDFFFGMIKVCNGTTGTEEVGEKFIYGSQCDSGQCTRYYGDACGTCVAPSSAWSACPCSPGLSCTGSPLACRPVVDEGASCGTSDAGPYCSSAFAGLACVNNTPVSPKTPPIRGSPAASFRRLR